jgi:hypothetical protein
MAMAMAMAMAADCRGNMNFRRVPSLGWPANHRPAPPALDRKEPCLANLPQPDKRYNHPETQY